MRWTHLHLIGAINLEFLSLIFAVARFLCKPWITRDWSTDQNNASAASSLHFLWVYCYIVAAFPDFCALTSTAFVFLAGAAHLAHNIWSLPFARQTYHPSNKYICIYLQLTATCRSSFVCIAAFVKQMKTSCFNCCRLQEEAHVFKQHLYLYLLPFWRMRIFTIQRGLL